MHLHSLVVSILAVLIAGVVWARCRVTYFDTISELRNASLFQLFGRVGVSGVISEHSNPIHKHNGVVVLRTELPLDDGFDHLWVSFTPFPEPSRGVRLTVVGHLSNRTLNADHWHNHVQQPSALKPAIDS